MGKSNLELEKLEAEDVEKVPAPEEPPCSGPIIQRWNVMLPYIHLQCGLGEGPYYEPARHYLRFVDIKKKRLHIVDLYKSKSDIGEQVKTIQLDTPVTVTADIDGVDPRERIAIGAKYGVAVLDLRSGKYEYVSRFSSAAEGASDNERIRSNDGAIDPHGRFWLGTMTDIGLDLQPEGSLYLFDGKTRKARSVRHPVTIPNSISWSPDKRTMYFTDSVARTIFARDCDVETGDVSEERVFYKHNGPGEPDGHRVDVEGNLWQAVYGEGRVLKISPQGKMIGEITLPTKNITCVEFVGTELYITTAGMEEGEGTEEEVELSGALFKVDVFVEGLKPHLFKLS
ncbi:SMP-30/Gluconolaconase/LRE-like region-domain-containing protein [Annulohypoxylon nitens]|nr:SMP-30/Gluconolaconase/LRE-like region-domain-containing protein [Annulohypoxylon nitens]